MKRLALLVFATAVFVSAADLPAVRSVYVLKMSRGFDQYLANRLTGGHVFRVVTDPKLADAVLTDQIGEAFQTRLNELYPPPEPEKPKKPEKPEKPAKPANPDVEDELESRPMLTDTVNKLAPVNSVFGRGKGMVFLVDPKSKEVIWSSYNLPKDSTSKELDRTATDVVNRIKRDLTAKKK
jgi:hypothetical protein